MKSYKNLYPKLCSYTNLEKAFQKASKNKCSMFYVKNFEENLENNLKELKYELETFTYKPLPLKKFILRDPKTRVIRKSYFRDRVIHHALVNILEPIYEKKFIHDSYANRINKGTLGAVKRFDKFKRKISHNGKLIKNSTNNSMISGYVFKADIKHFFDSVNHEILIRIIKRTIKDKRIIWLVNLILKNFDDQEKGMPLGNMTSQFLANVYLNDLDYFIKHKLKIKYYIRYVDDFVILHENKPILDKTRSRIEQYLMNLRLELHPDKSKIFSIYKGVDLLGYRIFYYHKLLRRRNLRQFYEKLEDYESLHKNGFLEYEDLFHIIKGWFAYAIWANTYKLRKEIMKEIKQLKN